MPAGEAAKAYRRALSERLGEGPSPLSLPARAGDCLAHLPHQLR